MSKKKKRLSFDAPPAPLNDAFAGLAMDGLAAGPDTPPEETTSTTETVLPKTLCLRREKAGRGGKTVIVVTDFPLDQSDASIAALAKRLKQHCGSGGSVKEREIVLQGDKAKDVAAFLEEQGIRVSGVTT